MKELQEDKEQKIAIPIEEAMKQSKHYSKTEHIT